MKRIVKLDTWTLPRSEPACIHWLRSPSKDPVTGQWRATAVFRLESGSFRELEFPWGALPWMRLGQWLLNGELVNRQTGVVKDFSIDLSGAELWAARDLLSADFHPLPNALDGEERCWLCPAGPVQVILPMLECIRAFLVPTRAFAYGLLEPHYPERIVTRAELLPDRFKLRFSNDIPLVALTPPVVLLTARLWLDESFRRAWRLVYHERFKVAEETSWTAPIPLVTIIPNVRSWWRVRGLRHGNWFLVLEILRVEPLNPFPVDEVEFEHPNLVQSEPNDQASKSHHTIDRATKFKLETGPEPANAISEPLTLATPPMALQEPKRYRVKGIRRPRPTTQSSGTPSELPLKELIVHPNPTDTEESVTAAAPGLAGVNRGVEFIPLPTIPVTLDPQDGLAEFCEAVRVLQFENPNWNVTWLAREIPGGTAFGSVNGRSRKYVAVTLLGKEGNRCCLLEIGRPDDFSISTLLFVISGTSGINSETVVSGLVAEGLHPQGGWNRAQIDILEKRYQLRIGWVKHYDQATGQWAQRLGKKVIELAGS